MPKVAVICTECVTHVVRDGKSEIRPFVVLEQTFPTFRDLAFGLQGLLISCHAKPSHIRHALRFEIEGEEAGSQAKQLAIRCISMGCRADIKEWAGEVPIEMVGAFTIMFHTGHEGHPLQITYDGQTWATP